jgi:ABC-2 type transport system permease protein
VCIAAGVSKFDETKRIAIHDESGLFVKEFIAQNNSKSEYKYLDLSLIDAQPQRASLMKIMREYY